MPLFALLALSVVPMERRLVQYGDLLRKNGNKKTSAFKRSRKGFV